MAAGFVDSVGFTSWLMVWLFGFGFWFGCLVTGFVILVFLLILFLWFLIFFFYLLYWLLDSLVLVGLFAGPPCLLASLVVWLVNLIGLFGWLDR